MAKIFSVNFNKSLNDKYGSTATLGATALVRKDEKGYALKCQSVATDYITYGDLASINAIGTGEFSFVVGANNKGHFNHGSANNSLFGKALNLGTNGFGIYYQNNTSILVSILNSNISATINHQNKNNIYIVTRNSSGLCTFYVNGISYGTPVTQTGTISSASPLSIGYDGQATTRTPNASIYLGEVYNHCLSEEEIQKLTADFIAQLPIEKPKRNFLRNKPTDLSEEVNNTVGTQLITNGSFDSATGWTIIGESTISGGVGRVYSSAGANSSLAQLGVLIIGKRYRFTYDVVASVTGTVNLSNSTILTLTDVTVGKSKTFDFTAVDVDLYLKRSGVTDITLDNVSVQELSGLVAAYNMIPNGNTMVDISGTGKNGVITNCVSTKNGLIFGGVNSVIVSNSTVDYSSQGSICFRVKFKDVTSAAYLFRATSSGSTSMDLLVNGGNFNYQIKAANIISTPALLNKEHTVVATWLLGGNKSLYIDGVLIGSNTYPVAFTGNTGFCIGANSTFGNSINAEVYDFKMYNKILSTQEINDYHNSFVKLPVLDEDFSTEPADGTSIVPKEWIAGTGTYKVVEATVDEGNYGSIKKGTKYLQCITAGTIAIPSNTSFGTYEFDFYKGADGNISNFQLMSDKIGLYNNTNGYLFFISVAEAIGVYKASSSNLNSTASSYVQNNTWYRIKVTRSNTGVFTVYIKGGAFTPTAGADGWTLVSVSGGSGTNPVTDTTYQTSNYFVLDLDAGDRFGNLVIKPGIIIN